MVEDLEWVTEEQQALLDELHYLRGDWREWLPEELTNRWPEWTTSTPDVLTPWLDDLIPNFHLPTEAVNVEDLSWITSEQHTQLDQLHEIWGDWREWLPQELTNRWPEWTTSTPDVLTPWLDDLIPMLVLPVDATFTDEEIRAIIEDPQVQAVTADLDQQLEAMLADLSPAEREQLAHIPPAEIQQWVEESLARALQS